MDGCMKKSKYNSRRLSPRSITPHPTQDAIANRSIHSGDPAKKRRHPTNGWETGTREYSFLAKKPVRAQLHTARSG